MIESEIWPVLIIGAIGLVALWPWGKSEHTEGDEWHDYRPKPPAAKNYEYIHDKCGKPAFFLSHRPMSSEPVMSSGVTLVNGEPARSGQPIICGSCGLQIHGLETRCVRKIEL